MSKILDEQLVNGHERLASSSRHEHATLWARPGDRHRDHVFGAECETEPRHDGRPQAHSDRGYGTLVALRNDQLLWLLQKCSPFEMGAVVWHLIVSPTSGRQNSAHREVVASVSRRRPESRRLEGSWSPNPIHAGDKDGRARFRRGADEQASRVKRSKTTDGLLLCFPPHAEVPDDLDDDLAGLRPRLTRRPLRQERGGSASASVLPTRYQTAETEYPNYSVALDVVTCSSGARHRVACPTLRTAFYSTFQLNRLRSTALWLHRVRPFTMETKQ